MPFTHVKPPEERDPRLKGQLATEAAPAILAWLVRGCLAYQSVGIGTCPAVEKATESYRGEMDPITGWVEDRCVRHVDAKEVIANLFRDYKAYCAHEDIQKPLARRTFTGRLKRLQLTECRVSGKRAFSGIGLRTLFDSEHNTDTTYTTYTTDSEKPPLRERSKRVPTNGGLSGLSGIDEGQEERL